jgi:hypothetical protein
MSNRSAGNFFIKNQTYTVVLNNGAIHNFAFEELLFTSAEDFCIAGNILLEKHIALVETVSGKCDVRVDKYEILNEITDLVQIDRIFIAVPRRMIISPASIAVVEEAGCGYFRGEDKDGRYIDMGHQKILEVLPHWNHFYSKELDGFYTHPPLIKGQIGIMKKDQDGDQDGDRDDEEIDNGTDE